MCVQLALAKALDVAREALTLAVIRYYMRYMLICVCRSMAQESRMQN